MTQVFASSASKNAAYGGVDPDENWNAGVPLVVDEASTGNHVGRRPEGISDNTWELMQQHGCEEYDPRQKQPYDPNKPLWNYNPNKSIRRARR